MKKPILLLILMALAFGLAGNEIVDRIMAKVGGEIILMSDIQRQMLQMRAAGIPQEQISPPEVLQELIEQKLILQKAKELDIKLNEERISQYAESYIKQVKSRYPSEDAFKKELAESKTSEGELLEYYINVLREQALTEQLVERFVTSRAVVTEAEMRLFYEEHKDSLAVKPVTWETAMIMREINASEDAIQARLDSINAIHTRIMNGEDFAEVARSDSDCPSKARGGDLGFFNRGMMVKPFEDAAFSLNVGEVSDVVRTEFGFHIIKVEEKRGNEVRARHILKIIQPTAQDSLDTWEQMENIRLQIQAGEPVSNLAKQYSADKESAKRDGIIGEFDTEGMPELFRAAILGTPVGQPTPVLENEGMLYIFERTRELPSRMFGFDEVKDEIGELLAHQKQLEAYTQWISDLADESYVQVMQ